MEGKLCTIFELLLPVLTEPIWLIYDLIIPECLPIIVGEMIVHIIVFGARIAIVKLLCGLYQLMFL